MSIKAAPVLLQTSKMQNKISVYLKPFFRKP